MGSPGLTIVIGGSVIIGMVLLLLAFRYCRKVFEESETKYQTEWPGERGATKRKVNEKYAPYAHRYPAHACGM
jgi:multisubunit Na+/H+ antiporter MnhB subunit